MKEIYLFLCLLALTTLVLSALRMDWILVKVTYRNSNGVVTFNSTPAGTTIGRNDKECGQMGVIIIAGTFGWIIEAPAATA